MIHFLRAGSGAVTAAGGSVTRGSKLIILHAACDAGIGCIPCEDVHNLAPLRTLSRLADTKPTATQASDPAVEMNRPQNLQH